MKIIIKKKNNHNNEGFLTYDYSVNNQPFVNTTSIIYQNPDYYYTYAMPYNPFYAVSPVGTTSQYTVLININQSYFHLITQQLLVSENTSVPTHSYTI